MHCVARLVEYATLFKFWSMIRTPIDGRRCITQTSQKVEALPDESEILFGWQNCRQTVLTSLQVQQT
jgi:hypothetical protein